MLPHKKLVVTVVGAGFSGLTTAHYLLKSGVHVRVLERSDRPGGLLGTRRTEHGLVETAANGILNSSRLESLCEETNVRLIAPRPESRARYIWRSKPRRWPLTAAETLRVGAGLTFNLGRLRPVPYETIAGWGSRVLGTGATQYALMTALGGIYAGDGSRMSASLIFRRSARAKGNTNEVRKPRLHGTVAPAGGMQELVDVLTDHIQKMGAEIHFNQNVQLKPGEPTVICTSASQAAALLNELSPQAGMCLDRIEMLSLVTATCFYEPNPHHLRGFGCLFPRGQGFRSRGVLFNDSIFDGRSDFRSETWILGGALDSEIVDSNDEDLTRIVAADHERLTGQAESPVSVHLTRWPQALPHYDLNLERSLEEMPKLPDKIVLAGNYLGKIGLARLLDRSAAAAVEIVEMS